MFIKHLICKIQNRKKTSFAIISRFKTTTHDVVFDKICDEKGLKGRDFDEFPYLVIPCVIIGLFAYLYLLPQLVRCSIDNDIRGLRTKSINIGHAINQWGISKSEDGQFKLNPKGHYFVFKCIVNYVRAEIIFKIFDIKLVIGGDFPYPRMSYAGQIAHKLGIETIFLAGDTYFTAHSFVNRTLSAEPFYEDLYESHFAELTPGDLEEAEQSLNARCLGDRSIINMPSISNVETIREYEPAKNNSIWIYLHDFYDAPGVHGPQTIFADHYKWAAQSIEFCRMQENIEVYVKVHPNSRPKNAFILNKLKKQFHDVHWVDFDIPLSQIKKNFNPNAILSVSGSIIVEASFLDIPVICAGRNRYVSCKIGILPRDKRQYFEEILKHCQKKVSVSNKANAIVAEALLSHVTSNAKTRINLPFDDISEDHWQSIFEEPYPINNYVRREIIFNSDIFLEWFTSKIASLEIYNTLSKK